MKRLATSVGLAGVALSIALTGCTTSAQSQSQSQSESQAQPDSQTQPQPQSSESRLAGGIQGSQEFGSQQGSLYSVVQVRKGSPDFRKVAEAAKVLDSVLPPPAGFEQWHVSPPVDQGKGSTLYSATVVYSPTDQSDHNQLITYVQQHMKDNQYTRDAMDPSPDYVVQTWSKKEKKQDARATFVTKYDDDSLTLNYEVTRTVRQK